MISKKFKLYGKVNNVRIIYQCPSSWLNSFPRWFIAILLALIKVIPPSFFMNHAYLDSTVVDRV
jgi:hypothetical protein